MRGGDENCDAALLEGTLYEGLVLSRLVFIQRAEFEVDDLSLFLHQLSPDDRQPAFQARVLLLIT
jgi:hypothetical protein